MKTHELKLIVDTPFTETLGLDVYTPDADTYPGARPLIVWVHGGGFRPGNDKSQSYIVAFSIEFAKRGYVCVAPDYRLRENPRDDLAGTIADAVSDVGAALQWIRDRADRYRIDSENVFLAGGSAGGMTVVTLCYSSAQPAAHRAAQRLNGLINLWGSPAPELTESFTYPEKTPYFSVHGTADELVPYRNGTELLERLKKHQVDAELMTIRGAPHTPMAHKDEIVARIQSFLDRNSR